MQVEINGVTVTIPTTLQEFTLGQRIRFQNEHGNELDAMAKSIAAMEDGPDKEFEIMEFNFLKMLRTFSFFSGVPVDVLKDSAFLDEVASIYHSSMAVLFEQEEAMELQTTFLWNGETWCLHSPELKQESKMTFNEIIQSKQIVQNMQQLGNSYWHTMLPLCAIFLRKENEPFTESLIVENSTRLKLMETLPLEYALQVGFFLVACLNFSLNSLPYFSQAESKITDSLAKSTLKFTDG